MLLAIQLLTGILLLTAYAPASTTAWGSLWYIQTQLPFGWFIRGWHVVATDALMVLTGVYLGVALVQGPFGALRRWHWWGALGMFAFVIAFAVTGYLLPYDQRAYWGTLVRINILARTPLVGEALQRLLLADDMPGTLALTRFHALHIAILPLIFAFSWRWVRLRLRGMELTKGREIGGVPSEAEPTLIGATRRPLIAGEGDDVVGAGRAPQERTECKPALPCRGTLSKQTISLGGTDDGTTSSLSRATVGLLAFLVLCTWVAIRHFYCDGTDLDAPADPLSTHYPARPEWWALPLFQWLKYFPTPAGETFAAIVVPGLLALMLVFLPIAPRWLRAAPGRRWMKCGTAAIGLWIAALTTQALWIDYRPGAAYRVARAWADVEANRAMVLALEKGIPPEGAQALLRADPLTRGPKLFAANCASCHRIHDHNGLGEVPIEPATSSDLGGFATRDWIRGLLADPMHPRYFGLMKNPEGEPAHTKMNEWIDEQLEANADPDARSSLLADFDAVSTYLADEGVHPGSLADSAPTTMRESDSDQRLRGRRVFMQRCNECHSYQQQRAGTFSAPEMYGYGSADWLELMIASPDHELRYRAKGRRHAQMPPFRDRLPADEIRLLAEWLYQSRSEPVRAEAAAKPTVRHGIHQP